MVHNIQNIKFFEPIFYNIVALFAKFFSNLTLLD